MRTRPAVRATRADLVITVACCSVVDGRLAVLVRSGARGALPNTPLGDGSLGGAATALVRAGTGRAPTWIAQSATIAENPGRPGGAMASVVYAGVVPRGTGASEGHRWIPVPAPLPGALAARDAQAVERAVATIRDRLDLDPVAFHLLPPEFTLTELQEVYELLLGRRLHKASFRRALAGATLVEPIRDWRSEGRGRPAQLHRFAPRRRRGVRRPVRFELIG